MGIWLMILIAALAASLLFASWRVLSWVWLRPKRLEKFLRQQGLSGTSYKLLSGDMKERMRMLMGAVSRPISPYDDILPRVFPFEHHSINTYGKDSFWWRGTVPRVTLMHPEQLKDVFAKIYDFQKSYVSATPAVKLFVRGLVNYDGDKWATHRKIINPAFHIEKLKLMFPAFHTACKEMVTGWEKLMGAEERLEIDVWTDLQSLTRDVISRTAFGSSYKDGRRVFDLQVELGDIVIKSLRKVYIPGWRFVPTKTNRRMKTIHGEIQLLIRAMIDEREKAMKSGKPADDDLLGLMLESNMAEIRHNKKRKAGMSIEDIIEECKLFYLAGQESTASLLGWAMVLLSLHPRWQDRAREEVLQVFGRDRLPDFDGLNHLKIVTTILYEVMRLYPPVPILARRVDKAMRLGKLTIPAGTELALPILFIHHDKELWGEDAKEFKPERFSEGISKATKNRVSFFPFGWGPRICVGQNFALIEAKMGLAMILQRFVFELSPSYAHAPISTVSLQPQHGVQVGLCRH